MATVRTIFQPDRDQEFPDDEAEMLRGQGLLLEPTAEVEAEPVVPPEAPKPVQVAATQKEAQPDGGK